MHKNLRWTQVCNHMSAEYSAWSVYNKYNRLQTFKKKENNTETSFIITLTFKRKPAPGYSKKKKEERNPSLWNWDLKSPSSFIIAFALVPLVRHKVSWENAHLSPQFSLPPVVLRVGLCDDGDAVSSHEAQVSWLLASERVIGCDHQSPAGCLA